MKPIKMTIVQKRPFSKNGYTGIGYAGFTEDGKVVKFTSTNPGAIEFPLNQGNVAFNPKEYSEVFLEINLFDPANPKYKAISAEEAEMLEE